MGDRMNAQLPNLKEGCGFLQEHNKTIVRGAHCVRQALELNHVGKERMTKAIETATNIVTTAEDDEKKAEEALKNAKDRTKSASAHLEFLKSMSNTFSADITTAAAIDVDMVKTAECHTKGVEQIQKVVNELVKAEKKDGLDPTINPTSSGSESTPMDVANKGEVVTKDEYAFGGGGGHRSRSVDRGSRGSSKCRSKSRSLSSSSSLSGNGSDAEPIDAVWTETTLNYLYYCMRCHLGVCSSSLDAAAWYMMTTQFNRHFFDEDVKKYWTYDRFRPVVRNMRRVAGRYAAYLEKMKVFERRMEHYRNLDEEEKKTTGRPRKPKQAHDTVLAEECHEIFNQMYVEWKSQQPGVDQGKTPLKKSKKTNTKE